MIPNGFFITVNLSGFRSLGFFCKHCRLTCWNVNTDFVFHCGKREDIPSPRKKLPEYRIQRRTRDGEIAPGVFTVGDW